MSKIIWAVDATQNPNEAKGIISELKIWAKRLNCVVQPVAIFSQSTLNYPVDITTLWKKGVEAFANESVNKYLKKTGARGFQPPQIVFSKTSSNREMSLELSKHAEKISASIIFANTRAKKSWNPIRLGGFAETLVATSRVPVLLMNPSASPSPQIHSVLFPTNFSRESKVALSLLQPWAKSFKSSILIYNQVERPSFYAPAYPGVVPSIDWVSLIQSKEEDRTKLANRLTHKLKKDGVEGKAIVQRERKSVSSDILKVADKHHVGLIAMVNHRGPIYQSLLGGNTRDILLQAKCPVLIFHRPKQDRKHSKKTKAISYKKDSHSKEANNETMVNHSL